MTDCKEYVNGKGFMSNIIVIDVQNIFTYGKGYYMKRPIIVSSISHEPQHTNKHLKTS